MFCVIIDGEKVKEKREKMKAGEATVLFSLSSFTPEKP
jgi:hypothetical protein